MENWDQAQLEEVVKKKQKGALPETEIVRARCVPSAVELPVKPVFCPCRPASLRP